ANARMPMDRMPLFRPRMVAPARLPRQRRAPPAGYVRHALWRAWPMRRLVLILGIGLWCAGSAVVQAAEPAGPPLTAAPPPVKALPSPRPAPPNSAASAEAS